MKPRRPSRALALLSVLTLCVAPGCANLIREADAVIWDAVPGTAKAGFDDQRLDGALVRGKIRFTCQRRQYNVTNIYETPYSAFHELYEVPAGLAVFVPAFLWYGVTEIMSMGAVESFGSVGPLHWSVSGLNPVLNVENGMFLERYRIRKKPGSQRPMEGSQPEPYDAVVTPRSPLQVAFEGGRTVDVPIGDEVDITINLVEVARAMPGPKAQRLDITADLVWDPSVPPVRKVLTVYLSAELAESLYALRDASRKLFTASDPAERRKALQTIADAGFTAEAARARDHARLR